MYFVRHGESRANAEGVLAGQQDSPLSAKGLQQARDEAEIISQQAIQLDLIISSPLSRAYDTATIIAERIGYPKNRIVVIDELMEKYGGAYEGQPIDSLFAASAEEVIGAGAETFDEFAERVRVANDKIKQISQGETLIVGHSGFYRMALAIYQGLDPEDMVKTVRPPNSKLLDYPI